MTGAIVVRRRENGGKGAALKTGIRAALEAVPDLAGVVTADAEGQHTPAQPSTKGRHSFAPPVLLSALHSSVRPIDKGVSP